MKKTFSLYSKIVLVSAIVFLGCSFDPSGIRGKNDDDPDASVVRDAITSEEGGVFPDAYISDAFFPDGYLPDAQVPDAYVPDAYVPLCDPDDCPLGCNTILDRCNRLNPSNINVQGFHDGVTGGITSASSEIITVNTDNGEITGAAQYRPQGSPGSFQNGIYWIVVSQTAGPEIAVFGFTNLVLAENSRIDIVGRHPAAFYVIGDVNMGQNSRINATASARHPGAGGGRGGVNNGADGETCGNNSHGKGGDMAGSDTDQLEAGGGGGGNRGSGGDGGDATYDGVFAPGGAGGHPGNTINLVPLAGGCGGGAGGGPDTAGNNWAGGDGGYGGGGGGAVQISAGGAIVISVGAGINVAGAGGQGGLYGAGGGGGGAGGSILLEAAIIQNEGLLAANGGGGGAGGGSTVQAAAQNGQNGGFNDGRAGGGIGVNWGGNGGAGGGGSFIDGQDAPDDANAGGGGGAGGRVRMNYLSTVQPGNSSPHNPSVHEGLNFW